MTLPAGGLGERLLDLLSSRVPAAGGSLTVSTKVLAEELGAKPAAVSYQLHRLVRAGRIATVAAGPRGTTIRLAGGRAGRASRNAERGPGRAVTGARRSRATSAFCPWCGRKAEDQSWQFCPSCGQELP